MSCLCGAVHGARGHSRVEHSLAPFGSRPAGAAPAPPRPCLVLRTSPNPPELPGPRKMTAHLEDALRIGKHLVEGQAQFIQVEAGCVAKGVKKAGVNATSLPCFAHL